MLAFPLLLLSGYHRCRLQYYIKQKTKQQQQKRPLSIEQRFLIQLNPSTTTALGTGESGSRCKEVAVVERFKQESRGGNPFNQDSDRSDQENWSTSIGGPVFLKLFRLDRADPLSFGPKFPEILVEWIAPKVWIICPPLKVAFVEG